MTSFYEVTKGEADKFDQILSRAGVDAEMVEALIRHPDVAVAWVKDLRSRLSLGEVWSSADEMVERLRERSALRGWPLPEEDIDGLMATAPTRPTQPLVTLSLGVQLGKSYSLQEQFDEFWAWAAEQQEKSRRWDGVHSDAKHLRLLPGIELAQKPRAEWVVIDLGANRGRAPRDVRRSTSPGLELLLAAALHPRWPRSINYEDVPCVYMPGLQLTVEDGQPWAHVPCLYSDLFESKVDLDANPDNGAHKYYAVPAFLDG